MIDYKNNRFIAIGMFDCYYCGKRLMLSLEYFLYEKHLICNVCKQKELKALLKKYNILSDIEM
jgi:hypothetical protein